MPALHTPAWHMSSRSSPLSCYTCVVIPFAASCYRRGTVPGQLWCFPVPASPSYAALHAPQVFDVESYPSAPARHVVYHLSLNVPGSCSPCLSPTRQVFDVELLAIRTCSRRSVLMFSDVVCE